jgi:hypothetical protein
VAVVGTLITSLDHYPVIVYNTLQKPKLPMEVYDYYRTRCRCASGGPGGIVDRVAEVAGIRMAMMGDMPASLLAAGTPDDVRAYVCDLVEIFRGRGLLIALGCDAPINAKTENEE